MTKRDLFVLEDLIEALQEGYGNFGKAGEAFGTYRGTFCSGCGNPRRMGLAYLFWSRALDDNYRVSFDAPGATPALFQAICMECHESIAILVHGGPAGPEVVALPSSYGGLSTPHTPIPVSFYLDQAQRSQAVGALSGAVAMYRAALEQLLYEQGYTDGMLKTKIDALTNDANPPRWRDQLAPDFLDAMKRLGNAAIHPNAGDISKQQHLNAALLREVRALFEELLEEAYEVEHRRRERLKALQSAAEAAET